MTLRTCILCLFVCASQALFAQTEEAPPVQDSPLTELDVPKKEIAPDDKVYELFDLSKLPAFPGGEAEMFKYIFQNLNYPPLAREKGISGHVMLSFIIDLDGKVTDANIIKDIGGGCGKEALRVIKGMPAWAPGEYKGHVVKSRYTIPVRFRFN